MNAAQRERNALDQEKNALNQEKKRWTGKNALDQEKKALNQERNALDQERNALQRKMDAQQGEILEGSAKGKKIGAIHFCERMLNRPESPREHLASFSLEELTRLAAELQAQVLKR